MHIRVLIYSMMILFVAIPAILGCAAFRTDLPTDNKEYPVALYVSSQGSSHVDPVNIVVIMDGGKEIVNKDFYCGNGHLYSTFQLNLTQGTHQIVVESSNGNAGLDVVFTVDKPLWLSLAYWGKNHFQLHISERALIFL